MNVDWRHPQDAQAGPADSLLAFDPLFARCADCLDAAVVRSHLARAFPDIDTSPGIEPVNVWFIPGKSLQVVYRVNRAGTQSAAAETLFRLRFHPFGESGRHAVFARAAAVDPARVRHIPAMGAVAWLFPDDAELPQLGLLLDDRYIARHLGPADAWQLLSYLPGRRCTVRYRFPDGRPGIVARVQTPAEAARNHGLARAAWAGRSRGFRVPEPAGYDARAGVFWEVFAAGQRLDGLLGTARFEPAVHRVIDGLVRLHTLRLPGLPREGAVEVLARTTAKVLPKVRLALPLLGDDLDAFSRALIARAPRLDNRNAVTLHGDLHTANVLIGGEGVVFIDLDRMSVGDPAYDLALLGTRMLLLALHGRAGAGGLADTVARLPRLYREAGGGAIEPATFAWYVAALLVGRQIKTAVRHLAPNAGRLAPALLASARRALEHGAFDRSALAHEWDEISDVHETANQA